MAFPAEEMACLKPRALASTVQRVRAAADLSLALSSFTMCQECGDRLPSHSGDPCMLSYFFWRWEVGCNGSVMPGHGYLREQQGRPSLRVHRRLQGLLHPPAFQLASGSMAQAKRLDVLSQVKGEPCVWCGGGPASHGVCYKPALPPMCDFPPGSATADRPTCASHTTTPSMVQAVRHVPGVCGGPEFFPGCGLARLGSSCRTPGQLQSFFGMARLGSAWLLFLGFLVWLLDFSSRFGFSSAWFVFLFCPRFCLAFRSRLGYGLAPVLAWQGLARAAPKLIQHRYESFPNPYKPIIRRSCLQFAREGVCSALSSHPRPYCLRSSIFKLFDLMRPPRHGHTRSYRS